MFLIKTLKQHIVTISDILCTLKQCLVTGCTFEDIRTFYFIFQKYSLLSKIYFLSSKDNLFTYFEK